MTSLITRLMTPLPFLVWLLTRHILPYGLIASGSRAELIDTTLQQNLMAAYGSFGRRLVWSKCTTCKTDILGWRKLKVCRKFSCYIEELKR